MWLATPAAFMFVVKARENNVPKPSFWRFYNNKNGSFFIFSRFYNIKKGVVIETLFGKLCFSLYLLFKFFKYMLRLCLSCVKWIYVYK